MSEVKSKQSHVKGQLSNVNCQMSPVIWAFFGTDEFSVIVLDELKQAGYLPTLIVTAPDRPQGRKLVMTPPSAKVWAEKHNIECIQPETLDTDIISHLSRISCQLNIVASYGKIIPQVIIDLPEYKTLNVHPSLLPKLRGASPVQTAILQETETGVSIMRIDEKMDHGPIIAQEKILEWTPETTPVAPELEILLAHEGGALLAASLPSWIDGTLKETPQDHAQATYTKKIQKADGEIDLNDSPEENLKKIRAFTAWPRAYFFITHNNKTLRVIITKASLHDGKLVIESVIPEGGKEMPYESFVRGYTTTEQI